MPGGTSGGAAQAFHAMAVVAAFRAAVAAARAVSERRAGRDPSAQEPPAEARAGLALAAEGVAEAVARLRLRVAAGRAADPDAAVVQAFEDRLALDDLARAARLGHQTLLSLYPDVPEALVEAARRLAAGAQTLATSDGPLATALSPLAEAAADWLDGLADADAGPWTELGGR